MFAVILKILDPNRPNDEYWGKGHMYWILSPNKQIILIIINTLATRGILLLASNGPMVSGRIIQ